MDYVIFIVAIVALLSHLAATLSLLWMIQRRPPQTTQALPFVSILKPLKGVDDQLEENLESFFTLDYENYELIFCAADRDDPALSVVRRVISRYPKVVCRVCVGAKTRVGLNPKVRVLSNATRWARGEILVVSDSNVRVRPNFLSHTMPEFEPTDVAAVSNLVVGVDERSLGAALENLQLNGFIAPVICFGQFLRLPTCVVGKSMAVRRSDLDAIGGWQALGNVLAEDFVLGLRLAERGRRAVISPHIVETVNDLWSIGRFLERHDRWLKMRWRINSIALLFELLANVTLWSVIAAIVAGLTPQAMAMAALLILGRAMLDAIDIRSLKRDREPPLLQIPLVPMRDFILAGLWVHARLSRSIRWREGRRLIVGRSSQLSLPTATTSIPGARLTIPKSSAEPVALRR